MEVSFSTLVLFHLSSRRCRLHVGVNLITRYSKQINNLHFHVDMLIYVRPQTCQFIFTCINSVMKLQRDHFEGIERSEEFEANIVM
jgi:hypothetical protein